MPWGDSIAVSHRRRGILPFCPKGEYPPLSPPSKKEKRPVSEALCYLAEEEGFAAPPAATLDGSAPCRRSARDMPLACRALAGSNPSHGSGPPQTKKRPVSEALCYLAEEEGFEPS